MTEASFQVQLTNGALSDLRLLHSYYVEHRSVEAADKLLDAILDRVESLETFPNRGSIPRELERLGIFEFRQVLVGVYRIIYRILDGRVFILVIVDGRRDVQALLKRRLLA